jgi:hypothetical protein
MDRRHTDGMALAALRCFFEAWRRWLNSCKLASYFLKSLNFLILFA